MRRAGRHRTIVRMNSNSLALPGARATLRIGGGTGPTVVFLPSAPGSASFDPDPEVTARAGIRLITVNRPGYGDAPAATGGVPTVAALADCVADALRAAGIANAAVAGWSAGGRTALGLAARHPGLVSRVALFGTPAPDDLLPWTPEEFRPMTEQMRLAPDSAMAILTSALEAMGLNSESTEMLGPGEADGAIFARPGVRDRVRVMLEQAFAQGAAGMATDIVADQVGGWGFDLAEVRVPVACFYGDGDEIIPVTHGEFYARTLPDARLTVVPGAGHLVPVVAWAEALGFLLG